MNTVDLYPLINEAGRNYDWAVTEFPQYFVNLETVCPIVWFGNLQADEPKIITFGSNPSDKEFHNAGHFLLTNPRFPKFFNRSVTVTPTTMYPPHGVAQNIEEDDNEYFDNNPYMSWFRPIQNFAKAYFGNGCCIHIDALPFATSQKFTTLNRNIPALPSIHNPHFHNFGDVLDWGADFARRLLQEIVDNDNVLGIVLVGGENIRQFKSIYRSYINGAKKQNISIGNRKFSIEKMMVNIGSKTIEIIGTSIYLPNPYGRIDIDSIVAQIKSL